MVSEDNSSIVVPEEARQWEQSGSKVRTKWGQETKSGNKRGTNWKQNGIKNLKV